MTVRFHSRGSSSLVPRADHFDPRPHFRRYRIKLTAVANDRSFSVSMWYSLCHMACDKYNALFFSHGGQAEILFGLNYSPLTGKSKIESNDHTNTTRIQNFCRTLVGWAVEGITLQKSDDTKSTWYVCYIDFTWRQLQGMNEPRTDLSGRCTGRGQEGKKNFRKLPVQNQRFENLNQIQFTKNHFIFKSPSHSLQILLFLFQYFLSGEWLEERKKWLVGLV